MAKNKRRFVSNDFLPTFGEEFSGLNEPEFDSQVWTTELVDDLIEKVEEYGLDLSKVKHPFFEKNIDLRQGRTAFQMTEAEMDEFKKCKKDIIHFANTYVKLMQEHGIDNIELYPYQVEMLKMYQSGRYSLIVGSRQIGKCHFPTTIVNTKQFGKLPIYKLWYKLIPNKTIFDRIKFCLYWCLEKIE